MSRLVIIDTDPGLDDAVGILFALASGRFDVLGLTTVAGNLGIETTTRNAGRLLALLGRADIPVIAGAAAPLARAGIDEAAIHGDDGLGGVALPKPAVAAQSDAVGWMAQTLITAPAGSIDLLALGPLTNLARLAEDAPEAARRLGKVIAMGGAIAERGNVGPRSEFNFASDPEAVEIVLRAGLDLTLVPLDVTRRVRADRPYLDALGLSGNAAARAAGALIAAYFSDGRESRPLHDPCVMLLALAADLFGVETLRLRVETEGDPGALVVDATADAVKVAMKVDADGALRLLAEGLGA